MELGNLKCPNCGANVDCYDSLKRAVCNYCGSNYILNHEELDKSISLNRPLKYELVKEDDEDILLDNVYDILSNLENILVLLSGISKKTKKCFIVKYEHAMSVGKDYHLDLGLFKVPIANSKNSTQEEVDISNLLKEYDFSDEEVKDKSWSYQEGSMNVTDKYQKIISKLIITPLYFDKYFHDYQSFIERIESNDVVNEIVRKILKVPFHEFYITDEEIHVVDQDHEARMKFAEFGMSPITDIKLLIGFSVVLATRIMIQTKQDDCYKYSIKGADVEVLSSFNRVSFVFKNMITIKEIYKEW